MKTTFLSSFRGGHPCFFLYSLCFFSASSSKSSSSSEEEDDDDEVEEEEENELDEDGDESLKQFLNGIDLLHLYPKLLEEAVELDTLLECNNHDDLKELGIEKAGHRCKILKTIKQGNYGKNQLMYIF